MIGDWIKVSENNLIGKVILLNTQPSLTHYVHPGVTIQAGEILYHEHVDVFEPIPLTSEIFEKNSFELNEQDTPLFTLRVYSLDDDDIAFLQRPKGGWKLMHGKNTSSQQELFFGESKFVCMPIQYVHELQHALRLCGIGKEIVL